MKHFSIKSGLIILAGSVVLGSCKKDPDVGIQDTGSFGQTSAPLKDAASFPIGAAIGYIPFINETAYSNTVKSDFNSVTFDYQMKHGAIVQNNGSMDFTKTDALVTAVGSLNIFGHTLAWHQNQNATYLKSYAGITIPAATELLTNPGFESGLTSWSVFNSGNPAGTSTISATTVPSEVRTGTGAMKVLNPTGYPGSQWRVQVSSAAFATTPGVDYAISYWVKAASAGGSIRLSSGPTAAQYQGDQTIGTTWQQVTWTITATLTSTTFLFDMGQAANTYYIDDASVKQVIVAPGGAQVAAKLDTAMGNFITAIVSRYKTKVKAWDVVNEPYAEGPVAIRNNNNTSTIASDVLIWSNYMGRDWALKAFNYAKAADPTADLYMNDYNLESNPAKLDSIIAFVAELKAKGAKIDGIGTQMHLGRTNISYAGIDAMMQKLAATGLKIRISELDVKAVQGSAAKTLTAELAAYQAVIYQYAITSYMKYIPESQRAGITVWGVNDKNSWLYNNGGEYPLMYDNDFNKKPAYSGFLQGLQ